MVVLFGLSELWLAVPLDRKSTRLNSSHTVIYTLSLHDALPILLGGGLVVAHILAAAIDLIEDGRVVRIVGALVGGAVRSEEHTSELQSHSDLHSFPTRRSSDLARRWACSCPYPGCCH